MADYQLYIFLYLFVIIIKFLQQRKRGIERVGIIFDITIVDVAYAFIIILRELKDVGRHIQKRYDVFSMQILDFYNFLHVKIFAIIMSSVGVKCSGADFNNILHWSYSDRIPFFADCFIKYNTIMQN